MPGRAPIFGGHLVNEVFPFVARNYRADMTQKIFAGHSYGSLLGYVLLLHVRQFN
jgi:predicted alpha/beta superfamily hydrolase